MARTVGRQTQAHDNRVKALCRYAQRMQYGTEAENVYTIMLDKSNFKQHPLVLARMALEVIANNKREKHTDKHVSLISGALASRSTPGGPKARPAAGLETPPARIRTAAHALPLK